MSALWIQDIQDREGAEYLKIDGTKNPADLMTKFTDFATLDKLCGVMGLQVRTGRAAAAPARRSRTRPSLLLRRRCSRRLCPTPTCQLQ